MVTIGYADFIKLFRVDNPDEYDRFAIKGDGVYVRQPNEIEKLNLIPTELAELTMHPTGDLSKPVLVFPCSMDELKEFVEFFGLHGYIGAFDMLKVIKVKAFTEASARATEEGRNYWPIVSGLYSLKDSLNLRYNNASKQGNDSRALAVREMIDELDALLPDKDDVVAQSNDDDQRQDPRERATMLRIIRALDKLASLPNRGATKSIEKQLEVLGFSTPKEDTIRNVILEARGMRPD